MRVATKKSIGFLLLFIFSGLIYSNCIYADEKKSGTTWGYTDNQGPKFWGTLDKAYKLCDLGKTQTPINIQNSTPITENALTIQYRPIPIDIIDDGLTKLNVHGKKTIINDGHTLQINVPTTGPAESILINKQKYHLVQFHIHTPSENQIDGKTFPLEIHFVNQGNKGNMAVIGVFVKEGNANPAVEEILNYLPKEKNKLYHTKEVIDISLLLPTNKSYYNFIGSLTTPPCTEGLNWFLMANPIEASAEQIAKLKTALPANNARPIQPLNGRAVTSYTQGSTPEQQPSASDDKKSSAAKQQN